MEKVAEHINEMQRIHEEYGAIFDHLFRQHQKSCKQPIDLSPGLFFSIPFLLNFLTSELVLHKTNIFQVICYIMEASNG